MRLVLILSSLKEVLMGAFLLHCSISLPDATFATLVAEVSSIRQIYSKLLISTLTFVETGEALATEMHTLLSYLLTTSSGRGIATAPMLRAIVDKGAILEAVSQATTHQFLQLLEKLRGVREEMDRVHAKLSVRKRDIKAWYKNLHEIATVVLALGTGLAGMAVIGATGGLAVPIIVGVGAVLATATSVLGGVLQHRTFQPEALS